MRYSTIIFDCFGVLYAEYYHGWLQAHGLRNEGYVATLNEAVDRGTITSVEFCAQLGKLTKKTASEVAAEQQAIGRLHTDTLQVVQALQGKGYRLGLISNAPSDQIRSILQEHQLEQYFQAIVISAEVGVIKPQPEIFYKALELLAAKPPETIFIDDNDVNIAAANELGLRGIHYTDSNSLRQTLTKLGVL